jgi:ribosomal protein S18 acetylase RimI-like enzyme
MSFAGLGSPIGPAGGAGLDRPFTSGDLDRIEDFYRSHGAPSQVDLCPLHDPEVFAMVKERGYAVTELNNVLCRKLDPAEEFPSPPEGCEIRRGTIEDADEASDLVERAFFPDGAPEAYQGLLAPLYQMDGGLTFIASVDGKMAACGAGLIIPEHRTFALCGAGTSVGYRGRGLQTALLRRRMAEAAEAGCEYAVVVTQGGSPSQKNCERLGFRVAYSKVTVIKNLDNA